MSNKKYETQFFTFHFEGVAVEALIVDGLLDSMFDKGTEVELNLTDDLVNKFSIEYDKYKSMYQ